MTKNNNNVLIDNNIDTNNDDVNIDNTLRDKVMSISDTSKKIRYLLSEGKSVKDIYHLFKVYGVTTKNGGEIRYQHVRNVSMTKLSNSN